MLGTALAQVGADQLKTAKPAVQGAVVPRKRGRPPLLTKSLKKTALVVDSSSARSKEEEDRASARGEAAGSGAEKNSKAPVRKEIKTPREVGSPGSLTDEKVRKPESAADFKMDLQACLDSGSFDLHEELYQVKHSKNSDPDFPGLEFQKELENLSQLANSLRQQYRELEKVGVADAHDNFVKYKIATDEKIQSCQEYSDYLEKKVEKLEVDALKAEEDLRSAIKEKEDISQELGQALVRIKQLEAAAGSTALARTSSSFLHPARHGPSASSLENTLSLYRELTGVSIYAVEYLYSQNTPPSGNGPSATSESDSLVFWCKQSGRNGQIHYSLVVPTTALEYPESAPAKKHVFVYKPIKEKLVSQDPHRMQKASNEWHKTSVEFERKMASLFFWRLSSYLHDQS